MVSNSKRGNSMSRVVFVIGGIWGIGEVICIMLKVVGYMVVVNYGGND